MSGSFSDVDSELTVGSDSDVTLPPDPRDLPDCSPPDSRDLPDSDVTLSPDPRNLPDCSPVLFEEDDDGNLRATSPERMEPMPSKKTSSLSKRHSKAHDLSDSGSESDSVAVQKNHRSSKPVCSSGSKPVQSSKNRSDHVKDPKIKSKTNMNEKTKSTDSDITKSELSNGKHRDKSKSPGKNSTDKKEAILKAEKRKFIDEFLNMSESDSDDNGYANIFGKSHPKHDHVSTSKQSKMEPITTDSKTKLYAQKPHKKDYTKPYASSSDSNKKYSDTKPYASSSDSNKKHSESAKLEKHNSKVDKHSSEGGKPLMIKKLNESEHLDRHSSKIEKSPSDGVKSHTEGTKTPMSKKHNKSATLLNKNTSKVENRPSDIVKHQTDGSKSLTSKSSTSRSTPTMKKSTSKSSVSEDLRRTVTEIMDEVGADIRKRKQKPECQYGSKCYRKNPSHLQEYSHHGRADSPLSTSLSAVSSSSSLSSSSSPSPSKKMRVQPSATSTGKVSQKHPHSSAGLQRPRVPSSIRERFDSAQPYSFFLTKVAGIADKYNSTYAMDIKDILSSEMGDLTSSCQFNFMFDIAWLVKQYPSEFRSKPLLLVHGEKGPSMASLQAEAAAFKHIKFCQAKLEMPFGTHHTKMMFLLYKNGMRVVIHTSNLIQNDWHQKTQGMWISPVFPQLSTPSKEAGDSPSHFKRDLIQYVQAYRAYQLQEWMEHIARHDMSSARVVIIGSVPGRHIGEQVKSTWGHLKLRKVLQQHGPQAATMRGWPVIGQFSSIGSMGANKENWVCGEWLQSLSATKTGAGLQSNAGLQLIFPSKDNVRLSLEGFPAGGSIPYSVKTAQKQTYLHNFFHVWKSEGRGRSRAMPHIKTYTRYSQDGNKAGWFICTSANLSKAAWGALEKKGVQLMIRSYEIGVLFLPKFFTSGETLDVTSNISEVSSSSDRLFIPYDLPAQRYEKKDIPWMWDIPYMDLPDTNGNVWCPFSK